MRLVVGITGATGAIFGIRLSLRELGVENHLALSARAEKTIRLEPLPGWLTGVLRMSRWCLLVTRGQR